MSRFFYVRRDGALSTDTPLCGTSRPHQPSYYGGEFFIGESMSYDMAAVLAGMFGGSLEIHTPLEVELPAKAPAEEGA